MLNEHPDAYSHHSFEGASTMPWYCNPTITCKVLNRIVNRYPDATINDLNVILGSATQLLWDKQENYYKRTNTFPPTDTEG